MIAAPTQQAPTPQTLAQAPMSQADADRKRLMHDAWKAYRGDFAKPLKVAANQPDDNVLANRCAPIVDKGVSFLFGQTLKIECGGGDDEDEQEYSDDDVEGMQDYLDGFWGDDDDKMTLLAQMAINGGVCGVNFVKLIPPQGQMKYPRLVILDPLLVRIVTAPDDCSLVLAFIIEYPSVNDWQKRQVIARVDPDGEADVSGYDLDETWTITNYVRHGQLGSWFQSGEQEQWPYPFPPIFFNQNLPNPNETWGVPDLTPDLINQNKVLNFVESNTSRIIKFHGHPITYAVGLNASQIQIGVDDLICLPSPESKLEKLEAMSNLTGLLAFAEVIRSNMDEQSRVPAVALGRLAELPKGNISGVALQLLFQPLIEKTTLKQRVYGRLIREVSRAALVIGGKLAVEEWEDYQINLHWMALLPVDDLQAAQTAVIYQQLGVSTQTLLQKLGFDPDSENEKTQEESQQELTNYARGQGMPPAPPAAQPGQPAQQPPAESPFLGGNQR